LGHVIFHIENYDEPSLVVLPNDFQRNPSPIFDHFQVNCWLRKSPCFVGGLEHGFYFPRWWFGTWLLFSPIVGMMIQSDFHSIIFQRVAQPPTSPVFVHQHLSFPEIFTSEPTG
jgi:hypothetical protein